MTEWLTAIGLEWDHFTTSYKELQPVFGRYLLGLTSMQMYVQRLLTLDRQWAVVKGDIPEIDECAECSKTLMLQSMCLAWGQSTTGGFPPRCSTDQVGPWQTGY